MNFKKRFPKQMDPAVGHATAIVFIRKTGTVRVLFGWLKKKRFPSLAACLGEIPRQHELRW